MTSINPVRKCIGCGEKRPTYRVGAATTDRACSVCIRDQRVPAVPGGEPVKPSRRK